MTTDDIQKAIANLSGVPARVARPIIEAIRLAARAVLAATDSPEQADARRVKTLPSHEVMASAIAQLVEVVPVVTAADAIKAIPGLSRAEAKALLLRLCAEKVVQPADPRVMPGCVVRLAKPGSVTPQAPIAAAKVVAPTTAAPMPPVVRLRLVPRVTHHARERWAEHHDDTSAEAVAAAWTHGLVLDNGVVSALTGAPRRADEPNNEYRMSPDYRGILVGVRDLKFMQIRTYLRMRPEQEAWLRSQYPEAAVTTH
jgi:hypothetical protein